MKKRILTLSPRDPVLQFAGSELIRHIELLSLPDDPFQGVPIELISQGNDPEDRFSYFVKADGSCFSGSNPRSVLLAIYHYLRKIGFVFHDPGEGGTYVPEISDAASLFTEETGLTASFRHRGVCIEGADSLENVLDFIDWLPKNGYNSFFLQFRRPDTFFERWYNHLNNPLVPPQHPDRQALDDMERQVTQAMVQRGILDHRVGHGWTAAALGCEATGWDLEENSLSPDMEALCAEIDGKRQLWKGVPTNTNLCYASAEARKRLVQQVVAYASSHRTVDYLHFWLADMANNLCECPACRPFTLTDQYVSLLNELDQALTDAGLSTKIVFLLYQELLFAPKTEKIRNPDRFLLMFAPISRTFEKTYPHMEKPLPLPEFVRNHFRFPETVEENISHYLNWKKVYPGECFFYDYPLGRAHYGDFGYMKIAKVIYDDIHSLKALGSDGYMSCQELRAMNPTGFPNFVMGQALLDLSLSYEDLKKTYFKSLYGDGWQTVVLYLEQLSELSDTDYVNGHGDRYQPEKRKNFLAIAETALAFLMDMDGMHEDLPAFRENWDYLRFHGRYCILLSTALASLCDGDREGADRYFKEFCDYIRQEEPRRQKHLDVYRVIEVSQNYTGL